MDNPYGIDYNKVNQQEIEDPYGNTAKTSKFQQSNFTNNQNINQEENFQKYNSNGQIDTKDHQYNDDYNKFNHSFGAEQHNHSQYNSPLPPTSQNYHLDFNQYSSDCNYFMLFLI